MSSSTGSTDDTSTMKDRRNSSSNLRGGDHRQYGSIQNDDDHDESNVVVQQQVRRQQQRRASNEAGEPQQRRRSSFNIEVSLPQGMVYEFDEDEEAASDLEKQQCDKPSRQSVATTDSGRTHLTENEVWNLFFCILAWACTIANVTLVVGTSNVVLLSIDGDPNLSSLPLATFFVGASLVSLLVTPWHFVKFGRKIGLLVGVAMGLIGSVLGCLSVLNKSTPLLIGASTSFGAAMGVGFYLRFAAVEVVPKTWADKAVTLVVSGGCIAAFAGPESAEGTRGMFGMEYEFLGVFVMTGIFNVANGIFTHLVHFPDVPTSAASAGDVPLKKHSPTNHCDWQRVINILQTRHFVIPMLISAGSWIIMALPMSVLRVAMHQVGYASRESLITIELHFLGMYAPGFFTGRWIARYGPRLVAFGAASVFLIAVCCLQLASPAQESQEEEEEQSHDPGIAMWIVGMVLIGFGWNCSFSASTVGSTRSYCKFPDCKSPIQAANDGLTFLLAGAIISCASFIYQVGGEGMEGWRTVNWIVFGYIGLFALILMVDVLLERGDPVGVSNPSEMWSTASLPLKFYHAGE